MNREDTKKAIEVMQAWLDGDDILINDGVLLVLEPQWNWKSSKYSVKPEPIERWIGIYQESQIGQMAHFPTKEACERHSRGDSYFIRAIKLREVTE